MNSDNNSFEYMNDEETLNSENSLVKIVQLLNKKYDSIDNKFNYNSNGKFNNINNEESNNTKDFIKNNEKINKNKNLIKKK